MEYLRDRGEQERDLIAKVKRANPDISDDKIRELLLDFNRFLEKEIDSRSLALHLQPYGVAISYDDVGNVVFNFIETPKHKPMTSVSTEVSPPTASPGEVVVDDGVGVGLGLKR